jgi:subtilisin family serine protease
MKVIVNKYLNVRTGNPSINAPCYQYLAPGSEIQVDGIIYQGDSYEGVDTWMKDYAGNYYWSGGLEKENLKNQLLTGINDKWWLKNFNIAEIWSKGITGKGVKIAILDTGISYPHVDLDLDKNLFNDVTDSSSGTQDLNGHGTHCTGIIKALNNEQGSIGIAYHSVIYVCKIRHDTLGDKNDYLVKGIKWAIAQNVDIISISKGDPFEDQNIGSAIHDADIKGILVVAAAGNRITGYPDDHIYYPARYETTLSVGGIDENNMPLQNSLLTNETNIFAPGKQILSTYKNNGFISLSGSSQATPYIAGVSALVLEFQRLKNPQIEPKNIKDLILKNADVSAFGKIINIKNMFT